MKSRVVVTQNLWGGAGAWARRRDLLLERLAALRPDQVALQEVRSFEGESQAHELARMLGYRALFAPARIEPGFCEGVALLSRTEPEIVTIDRLAHDPCDPLEGRSQRVLLHARTEIDVFVTHLSLSLAARARTVEEIVEAKPSGPSILMGDLNALPSEAIHARLATEWRDAWTVRHGARSGGTWPSIWPRLRYDYVYVSSEVTVREVYRLPFAGSDHRGVVAEIEIP